MDASSTSAGRSPATGRRVRGVSGNGLVAWYAAVVALHNALFKVPERKRERNATMRKIGGVFLENELTRNGRALLDWLGSKRGR